MHHLPPQLINSLQGIPGFNEEAFIDAHQLSAVVTSVRLNVEKQPAQVSLPIAGVVPWCLNGRYLHSRPSFTLDPVFHGGAYYVQEASSMFIDHIVKQICMNGFAPTTVLDLCGAPGGKSTLLAAALPGSFIVSNEVIKTRVGILAENITKWGSQNVLVTNNDPKSFAKLPGFFDLMMVDAPCSGSGLFKKDKTAINEWSEQNVQLCSMRQKRILADAIPSLRQDGYLIYSTCSYSKSENEEICDWIVEQLHLQPVSISFNSDWGMVETFSDTHRAPGIRFFPDRVQGEGFFVAVFKQSEPVEKYSDHNTIPAISKIEKAVAEPWLALNEEVVLFKQKELILAISEKFLPYAAAIQKNVYCRKSGVALGTIKGKDFIPHHEFALSGLANKNIHTIAVNEAEALKYLRRQDLQWPVAKKGWAMVSCQQVILGWVKVLPNRINNYYPTEWRILKP